MPSTVAQGAAFCRTDEPAGRLDSGKRRRDARGIAGAFCTLELPPGRSSLASCRCSEQPAEDAAALHVHGSRARSRASGLRWPAARQRSPTDQAPRYCLGQLRERTGASVGRATAASSGATRGGPFDQRRAQDPRSRFATPRLADPIMRERSGNRPARCDRCRLQFQARGTPKSTRPQPQC